MTVAALVALAIAAIVPITLQRTRLPHWAPAAAGLAALGVAGWCAVGAPTAHGFTAGLSAVLSVAAATSGGSPVARSAFRISRRRQRQDTRQTPAPDADPAAPAPAPEPEPADDPGPLRGGLMIGILERAAVAAAILSGWPEGIAVVLAVKGLARYPELREPEASEQFIIGTFASVLWAVAACGVGRALLG